MFPLRNGCFRLEGNAVSKKFSILLAFYLLGSASISFADSIFDFGGNIERYKGRGDRVPAQCQVGAPTAAGGPFKVLWNCTDNDTSPEEIKTEVWVQRKNSNSWDLYKSFLGFPAGLNVDANVLMAASVREGLPASFRVVAIDRAGNATFSPTVTVAPGQAEIVTCDLAVTTAGTDTDETGETTGIPSQSVILSGVTSDVISNSDTAFIFKSSAAGAASPCEISSVCENNGSVEFSGSGTIATDSTATGDIIVSPGGVVASLTGAISKGSTTGSVTSLELSGETTVEDVPATVELTCTSGSSSESSDSTSTFETGSDSAGVEGIEILE